MPALQVIDFIMRRLLFSFAGFLVALLQLISCSEKRADSGCAYLTMSFGTAFEPVTRAQTLVLPDTNDFILTLSASDGEVIYSGLYGDRPEKFKLTPGSYVAKAVSREFNVPAFDSPQFGDEVCVTLKEGDVFGVSFCCRQLNSGIRLALSSDFISDYDGGVLFLGSTRGRLMYAYAEKRYAYFHPGAVSLKMDFNGEEKVLFTKMLDAGEMLKVNLGRGDDEGGTVRPGMSIEIDTSRVWSEYDYIYGGNGGGDIDTALSVDEARGRVGETDLWVYGYVVGGDLTSTGISFLPPFHTYTNIAIASSSKVRDREDCLSVSLPSGEIRDALNLVDNPDMLGKRIFVKGSIVGSYFGLTGIKDVSEYQF